MTKKKANIIAITIGIITGILAMIPTYHTRVQNLGGSYIDATAVILMIFMIGIIAFAVYALFYLFWIQNISEKKD